MADRRERKNMTRQERILMIAKTAALSALSTVLLLVSVYLPLISVSVIFVFFAAVTTASLLYESADNLKWAVTVYFVTFMLAFFCGGMMRPISLVVYGMVLAPYFVMSLWSDARIKNPILRFSVKAVVMPGLCVLFFVALSPLFDNVKQVMEAMASLPMYLFKVGFLPGIVIAFSACAFVGTISIPIIDIVLHRFKNIYVKL
ncbi:MAG TPA: hypothetical protein DHV31_01395 [Clostridiales bacterium]|nr:hypothetical protein [Clostridiales bacterium]